MTPSALHLTGLLARARGRHPDPFSPEARSPGEPAAAGRTSAADPGAAPGEAGSRQRRAGRGTALLVEDEPAVRKVVQAFLERLGFQVLAEPDGPAAIDRSRSHPGEITLLVTDIVMPEMRGTELRAAIRRERPAVRCLYVSGYSAEMLGERGALRHGEHLLQKPFTLRMLDEAVASVLAG